MPVQLLHVNVPLLVYYYSTLETTAWGMSSIKFKNARFSILYYLQNIGWNLVEDDVETRTERLYLTDFSSHSIYPVGTRVIWIVIHLLAEDPRELIVHRISKSGQRSAAIRLDKPSMDVLKERKRDTSCNRRELVRTWVGDSHGKREK
jgi:hypothetical protein